MIGVCLAAGTLHAFLATTELTLAWTHSIEKIRWEEDYRVEAGRLRLVQARIRGSGAGMEPPVGAVLRDGTWHYRPDLPPLAQLELARSPYTADYELCIPGAACKPMGAWIPVSAGTTTLRPCEEGAR